MIKELPPSLARLARANPVAPDDARGLTSAAQAQLAAILISKPEQPFVRGRVRRTRRTLAISMAAALLVGTAAFAATDPFGFWKSSSPSSASFAVDPSRRVTTPTIPQIVCPTMNSASFSCQPSRARHGTQLRYQLTDQIRTAGHLDRAAVQQGLTRSLARGRLSAPAVRRIDAELAAVPNSFFTHLNELWRFSTYSITYSPPTSGQILAFIASGPTLLVCEPHGAEVVKCQNLNGDTHAPIGAGIYAVVPGPGWNPVTSPSPGSQPSGWRLARAVFGPDFTPAAQRLLSDLIKAMAAASTTTITGG